MKAELMKSKLGMFIHWGVYSIVAKHEQIERLFSHEEYENLYTRFNPKNYDPEKWVLLAKNAGMKYICFTAKHHDGFCMWDTKYTDYKITNTPYGKDTLKMLADACQKHGMLLSIYYSCPDWHYEYGYNPASSSSHQEKAKNKQNPDTEKLREYIKAQIEELMSNYGKIYTLFWDIPPVIVDRSINELVRELQPGIIINDRGFDEGDFSTPERDFSNMPNGRYEKATEACNSVGEYAWGYNKDENFYSVNVLRSAIQQTMARGGSYLINVGPNELGEITPEYEKRILTIGDWYNRMEGVLEDSEGDERSYDLASGGSWYNKYVVTKKNGKSYFHFYNGLISNHIFFNTFPTMPKGARLLNSNTTLPFTVRNMHIKQDDGLDIYNIPIDELGGEPICIEIEW